MKDDVTAQIWALSALMLALHGVDKMACHGEKLPAIQETLLPSLMRFNLPNVADYYNQTHNLAHGRALLAQLWKNNHHHRTLLQYALQIIQRERKIMANPLLMERMCHRLHEVARQAEFFPFGHETVMRNIATIYRETIGQAAKSIHIVGRKEHLTNEQNVIYVRVLLLCAVRAAVLWRLSGGSRRKLVFHWRTLRRLIPETNFTGDNS